MIAPASIDLQIARGIAFAHETAGTDERNRSQIPGLDVRFQPMQAQWAESPPNHEMQARRHDALALETRERVIAKVATAEGTKDHVRDIHHAGKGVVRFTAYEEAEACRSGKADKGLTACIEPPELP